MAYVLVARMVARDGEHYRDKAAFEEHGRTERFTRLGPGELFGLMEDRRREFYDTME